MVSVGDVQGEGYNDTVEVLRDQFHKAIASRDDEVTRVVRLVDFGKEIHGKGAVEFRQ